MRKSQLLVAATPTEYLGVNNHVIKSSSGGRDWIANYLQVFLYSQ